jgi:uncharacterized membrane protein YccC
MRQAMVPQEAPVPIPPVTIAGLPLKRWLFALRIWGAVVLALGLAFWLQLDGASSAGVCVAILAQQTRGQALEKATYRALGTVAGGLVAIILTDVFAQARDLYVLAYSAWLGLCVFTAGFLDGNRAYGAVLCGYTVSIVATQQIDMPDHVFAGAVNRGAAIIVGITVIAFVNDLLGASDIAPALSRQVDAARAQVRAFAERAREGRLTETDEEAGKLLRTVSGWHPEIGALPTETPAGSHRAAAIRAISAALVGQVVAARRLAGLLTDTKDDPVLREPMQHRESSDLEACEAREMDAAQALRNGRRLADPPRLPVYQPWQNALRNALRAFIVSTVSGFGFILIGWPEAAFAWGLVGVLVCLSANAPDPRILAHTALLALPVGSVLAGVTLFVFLDGTDAFPLLCLGLLLPVVAGALLMASPNPKYAGVGAFMTVFTLVAIAPANPQSYDPLNYCITSALITTPAIVVYAGVMTLFPAEDSDRRAWAFGAARRATRSALRGTSRRPDAEACVLDASRIAALSTLGDVPAIRQAADLAMLFWLADLRAAAQRVWHGLDRLGPGCNPPVDGASLASLRTAVQVGLQQPRGDVLHQAALALVAHGGSVARIVGADLALAAYLIDTAPADKACRVFTS